MHLTHTNVLQDPRILRSMKAAAAAGYDVSALGIADETPLEGEKLNLAKELSIETAVRPRMLKRKGRTTTSSLESGYLEVSHGKTGPVRRAMLPIWLLTRGALHLRASRPDMIHAHDPIALVVAVMLRLFFGTLVIYDTHELSSQKAGTSAFQGKLVFLLEKLCWSSIGAVITVSESIADWYMSNLGEPRAVVVLNSPEFMARGGAGVSSNIRADIGANESDLVYIYVGALEPGRGIDELVTSFSRFGASSKLALLGDGTIRSRLREAAIDISNIFLPDPVPHETLIHYISSADYGMSLIQKISLSDYLCLPNKVFEYLHAGMPIVCSDFPEMSRLVTENNFGFVISEDVNSITELLSELSLQPRPKKIELVRIQSYTWRAQSAILLGLYERLVGSANMPAGKKS